MPFDSESAKKAGQRSKRGASDRTKLLNDLLKPERAKVIFKKLEEKAMAGDMDAIKTYMAYCFGKPKETVALDLTDETVNIFLKKAI